MDANKLAVHALTSKRESLQAEINKIDLALAALGSSTRPSGKRRGRKPGTKLTGAKLAQFRVKARATRARNKRTKTKKAKAKKPVQSAAANASAE